MTIRSIDLPFWPASVLLGVALPMLILTLTAPVQASIYSNSAHGDLTFGVNRSTATCENWPGGQCVIGSCAHCHDTFDPNLCGNDTYGLLLFAANNNPTADPQADNFCYECHKGSGSVQAGSLANDTYSTNFGGGTPTFTTIYDAFNPATGATPSSHNLADVLNHVIEEEIVGFTINTNPCLVCHDQHASQRNYPVMPSGSGGVLTAVRRPIDYPSPPTPTNLWGDESGSNELMSEFAANYQAPYFKNDPLDPNKFEPNNDSTGDGSNLPNFKNFCLSNCHGTSRVYSTEHGAELTKIDWTATGDQHGRNHETASGRMGYTIAPYDNLNKNYVLSCTDCHEPHGSENEYLLRTSVNGKDNISVPTIGDVNGNWWDFCTACHVLTGGTTMYHRKYSSPAPSCPTCHYHDFIYF